MPIAFPTTISVGEKSKRKVGFRVLKADFGDGYGQTVPDGLNTSEEMWDLSFDNYPLSQIQTLMALLDTLGGVDYFTWTPPLESASKKWQQDGAYDVSFDGPLTASLGVTVKRVYTI